MFHTSLCDLQDIRYPILQGAMQGAGGPLRKGYEIRVIGDALSPRRIIDATLEGAQAGHAI